MKIGIVTDTSSGFDLETAKKNNIYLVPMSFTINNLEYDDFNLSKDDFYQLITEKCDLHTSQPSSTIISKIFDEALKENDKILYFPITSGLSSSYDTSVFLSNEEKYKGKVFPVDHRTISVALVSALKDCKRLVDKNLSPEKIKELFEKNAKNNSVYIMVETLDYLKRGGRVSPLVASIGNLLRIKPVMYSDGGSFDVVKKARSVEKAKEAIVEFVKNDIKNKFEDSDLSNYVIGVAHTRNIEEAEKFKEELANEFSGLRDDIIINELPLILACHIGPNSLALAIYKKINEY